MAEASRVVLNGFKLARRQRSCASPTPGGRPCGNWSRNSWTGWSTEAEPVRRRHGYLCVRRTGPVRSTHTRSIFSKVSSGKKSGRNNTSLQADDAGTDAVVCPSRHERH